MPLNNPGISALSQLTIDADVDWGAHTISNINLNMLALVLEKRTDDPTSPVDGRIWLRTDL